MHGCRTTDTCDIGHADTCGQAIIHTLTHTTDYLSYTHTKLFLTPLTTNWPQSRKDKTKI